MIQASPAKIVSAIFSLFFAVMFAWWLGLKVPILASFFTNGWITALFWLSYFMFIVNSCIIMPGAIILGRKLGAFNVIIVFLLSFAGMVMTLVALAIVPAIFNGLLSAFSISNSIYMALGWFILFIFVLWSTMWMPLSVGLKEEGGMLEGE